MASKNIDFDVIVIVTLTSIIIAGLFSVVYPFMQRLPRYDFSRSLTTVTSRSPKLAKTDVLVGHQSHFYNISYELKGYDIYINAYSLDSFNFYLYNPKGCILWSKENITLFSADLSNPFGLENPKDLTLGVYTIKIYNPSIEKMVYEVFIELRPIG